MKVGKQSFRLSNPVYIRSAYTIVGPKEGEGNFGDCFDMVLKKDIWGEKSFEKAECKMHRHAIQNAIIKAGLKPSDIDIMLAGDLLNEISASCFSAREFPISFLGMYNACSTFSEAIIVGSMIIDGGFASKVTCSTSSHYASAERQYRYPLELGNQRTPTAQWTVTGAGCTVLTSEKPTQYAIKQHEEHFQELMEKQATEFSEEFAEQKLKEEERIQKKVEKDGNEYNHPENQFYTRTHVAKITGGTIGRVMDLGVDDETNMGAAMAPAAADTILRHFEDTGTTPGDYDAIFTGDLGRFGKGVLEYLLSKEGILLPDTYMDCGASFYTPEQRTYQGGSGAGCVCTAFNGYVLKKLENGTLKKVLIVPTGALLNKDTPLQKETIPSISHAFVAESEEM